MAKPSIDIVVRHAGPLTRLVAVMFTHAGASAREADLIAEHLVAANLAGHDSHGIGVITTYLAAVKTGGLAFGRNLETIADHGALLHLNACQGPGQVQGHDAVSRAVDRARTHGVAVLALVDSHHLGRIGHYAEQCAGAGFASIHFVNVPGAALVAPFGGTQARLGTNPFAAGFPRLGGEPVIVDFATSRYAGGKVRVALNSGVDLPPGVLLDANGLPTVDPVHLFSSPQGALLPFGEHKGYGLALACEILAGALLGGRTQAGHAPDDTIVNSMLSVVFAPAAFGPVDGYERRLDALVSWVTGAPPRIPGKPVLLPGDPERATRARRLAEGVPIDATTWAGLVDAARALGVDEALIG